MSGPIVRTGTTPEFWKNWDQAFGDKGKKKTATAKKAAKKTPAKKVAKPATKKATTAKKVAKKKSGKK